MSSQHGSSRRGALILLTGLVPVVLALAAWGLAGTSGPGQGWSTSVGDSDSGQQSAQRSEGLTKSTSAPSPTPSDLGGPPSSTVPAEEDSDQDSSPTMPESDPTEEPEQSPEPEESSSEPDPTAEPDPTEEPEPTTDPDPTNEPEPTEPGPAPTGTGSPTPPDDDDDDDGWPWPWFRAPSWWW